MFSFIKQNASKSILLFGLTIIGIILLVSGAIKGLFILSHESAVQKAEVLDVVLGTLSLGLTLLGLGALSLVTLEVIIKKKEFNKLFTLALLGAAGLFIISILLVVVKDHEGWTTDWKKLNDLAKAREDIGSNLVIAHTLATDAYGNKAGVTNTLTNDEFNTFLTTAINSKKDLAALYPVDELLNKFDEPLIAGKIVDNLAAAWQKDNTLTVSSYFATPEFHEFLKTLRFSLATENNDVFKAIRGLASQPVVFTGLTVAYLQGFPLDITGITVIPVILITFVVLEKFAANPSKNNNKLQFVAGSK